MEIPSIMQSSVPKAVLKNKGDIATAASDGQLETLSVGPDGTVLTADSSQPTGFKWVSGNNSSGSTNWGGIVGNLNNQADLFNVLNDKEPANTNIQGHIAATGNPHGTTKAEIGLGNVTNDAQIPKTAGTAKGSLLGFSGASAPAEVPVGADNQVLTADSTQPSGVAWKDAPDGTAAWGSIDGALSNQTDLQTALNSKAPTTSGTAILKGDGSGGFGNAVAGADYLTPTGDGSHLTGITPSQVGLVKVSNDKQVKAATASTDGNFVSWSGTTGDSVIDSGKKAADFAAASHVHTPNQVGLGNVTNDAQLKSAAGDFASFTEKTSPVSADLLLIEDSTANGAKKKVQVGNLPGGVSLPAQTGHSGQFLTTDGSAASWGSPSIDPAAWNAIASKPEVTVGDTGCGATIQSALTAIGANEKILVVPPGNYAGPAIVPSNVTIRFARGALLTSGTLTINGGLQAGDYQIVDNAAPNTGTLVIGATCLNQYVNPRWWGAKGNNSTSDKNAFVAMNTAIGSTPMTVKVPPGTYLIDSDISINSNIDLVLTKGAMFNLATVAIPDTLSNTFVSHGAATITVHANNTTVTASSNTNLNNRDWIKTNGGNYYRVRRSYDSTHIYIYHLPVEEAATVYSSSTYVCNATSTANLVVGDFLYVPGITDPLVVSKVVDASTFWVYYAPPREFSSALCTRGVRFNITGTIRAGKYQIFTGNGLAQLGATKVYPEWWGAKGDGAAGAGHSDVNAMAIWKAVFSNIPLAGYANSSKVVFGLGRYYISRSLPMAAGVTLTGGGNGRSTGIGSWIIADTGFLSPSMVKFPNVIPFYGSSVTNYAAQNCNINNLAFDGNAKTYGNKFGIDGIFMNTGQNQGVVEECLFYSLNGWAVLASNRTSIRNNFIQSCYNGIYHPMDGWILNNEINIFSIGMQELCNNFTTLPWDTTYKDSHWTANGTFNCDGGTDGVHSGILRFPLSALIIQPIEAETIAFELTITARTAGTINVTLGDTTLINAQYKVGTYLSLIEVKDYSTNPYLVITSNGFNGSIDNIKIYNGAAIKSGAGNVISGNIAFGDLSNALTSNTNPGGGIGLQLYDHGNQVSHNRIGPFGNALVVGNSAGGGGGGILNGNNFGGYQYGIQLYNVASDMFDLSGNYISGVNYGGIKSNGTANSKLNGNSRIINNIISGPTPISLSAPTTPGLIENNIGVDVGAVISLTANSATPDAQTGKNFVTANTSATNITDFLYAPVGKSIFMRVNDVNTTFKFTGTTNLVGHGGADFAAAPGDIVKATKMDDGKWYCECIDNTP
jgi:hypothetical protein